VLDPGLSSEQTLHAKLTMTLRKGQLFRHELPGAGGYGDAMERDLALVAKDLRDGLVTPDAAAREYGVVAHGDPPQIDAVATATARAQLRTERGSLPEVAWETPA
jgi:N-methylhydantoinase B